MGTMLGEEVSYTDHPIFLSSTGFYCNFLRYSVLGWSWSAKATLVGFMAGAAIIVSLQQLKGLLGIVHFTNKMQIVPVLTSVFQRTDEWSWQTIILGASFLLLLLTTRKVSMRNKKLFWVSAVYPLTSVILSTLIVFCLKSKLPMVKTVMIINTIYIFFIVKAVLWRKNYEAALKLWKVDKIDFFTCLCSFFGVLFIAVHLGLAIAVGVSVFKILLHVTRPNTAALGNIPGTHIYQRLRRNRESQRVPYFLLVSIEAPMYFSNSTYLQE
ncbi:hypothetical protein AG4045_011617, partial [Apium graveolens]